MEFTSKFIEQFGYLSRKEINAIINSFWLIMDFGASSLEDLRSNKAALNYFVFFKAGVNADDPTVANLEEWRTKYVPIITSLFMSEFENVCAILFALPLMNSDSEGRKLQLETIAHLDATYEEKNHRKLDASKVTKISKIIAEECLDFVHDYRFKSQDELIDKIQEYSRGLQDIIKKLNK